MKASEPSNTQFEARGLSQGADLVRVVASLLVVCVHCVPDFVNPVAREWTGSDVFCCVLASVARVCVPLFFLLSGSLLLKPDIQPLQFYRKRLNRLAMPLLFWSGAYILLRITMQDNEISFLSAIRLLYNGEVYYHLGFLYALAGVYLAIPFLSPLSEPGRKALLWGFVGFAFTLDSLMPFCDRMVTAALDVRFSAGVSPGFFWIYAGYACTGLAVARLKPSRRMVWRAGTVFIATSATTVELTLSDSLKTGELSEGYFGYHQPLVFLAAVAAFALTRSVRLAPQWRSGVQTVARLSFGVYLIHPLLLDLLRMNGWSPSLSAPIGLPIQVLGVFTVSAVLTALLLRFPFLKRTV